MPRPIHYTRSAVKAFLEKRYPDVNWEPVVQELPNIVQRSRWDAFAERLGLPYSRGYIQNLDSNGIGPSAFM